MRNVHRLSELIEKAGYRAPKEGEDLDLDTALGLIADCIEGICAKKGKYEEALLEFADENNDFSSVDRVLRAKEALGAASK